MIAFAASCVGAAAVPVAVVRRHRCRSSRRATGSASSSTRRCSSARRRTSRSPGVTIGKVVSVGLDHRTGLTRAVLQIDPKYAPRPAEHARDPAPEDAARGDLRRAVLRQARAGRCCTTARSCPRLRSRRRSSSTRSSTPSIRRRAEPSRRGCRTTASPSPTAGRTFNDALAELYPFATNVCNVLARAAARQHGDQHAAGRRRSGAVGDQPQPEPSCRA